MIKLSEMSVSPEVLFDRYFRTRYPSVQAIYRGKQDLDLLEQPELRRLLLGLQTMFNQALNDEQTIREHVDHPPFHLDYISSTEPNALAFRYAGYSFVGITVPLILLIWDVCTRLSRSEKIAFLLGIQSDEQRADALRAVLLQMALYFVVTHEYTHHVHGHVLEAQGDTLPRNEILDDGPSGDLQTQTHEADADGYAAYHLMGNFIGGSYRRLAIEFLGLDSSSSEIQDEVLFSCIAVAVGGFFLLRPVQSLDKLLAYSLTHPPPAARLNVIIKYSIRWCKQNRPELEARMSSDRFTILMTGGAEVFWGEIEGAQKRWQAQADFLRSADGVEYLRKLDASLRDYIAAL
jgi:hypothetical protein